MNIVDMIKDCAFEVYKELGPGHLEKVYQRAMSIEFDAKSIVHRTEYKYDILYKGHIVGQHRLDFLILHDTEVIVELKAVARINKHHKAQLRSYMRTLKIDTGVLSNFGYSSDNIEPDIFVETGG